MKVLNLIKEIKDARQFIAFNGGICWKSNLGELRLNETIISKKVSDFFHNKNWIQFNQDNETIFYNTSSGNEYILANYYSLNAVTDGNSAFFVRKGLENALTILNLETQNYDVIYKNYNWESIYMLNNSLYLQDNSSIKKININSGKISWEFRLKDTQFPLIIGDSIYRLLLEFNDSIIVSTSKGMIVLINSITGKTYKVSHPFKGLKDANNFPIYGICDWHIEHKKNQIIQLSRHFYGELKNGTEELSRFKNLYTGSSYVLGQIRGSTDQPKDIDIRKSAYTNEYIFFIGGLTFVTNMIGIFNRNNMDIEYTCTIDLIKDDKHNNLSQIQQSDCKVYVLDTSGNLRVYAVN